MSLKAVGKQHFHLQQAWAKSHCYVDCKGVDPEVSGLTPDEFKWALGQIQKGSRELQWDSLNLSWICLGNPAHKRLSHLDLERLGLLNCCLVTDALIFANVSSFCTQCELGPELIPNVWNLSASNSIFSGIIQQALCGTLPHTTYSDCWEFKLSANITDWISQMFTKN